MRSGRQGICRGMAMANGRCFKHGGKALKGIHSGTFKGKGYAEILPFDLPEASENSRNNPDLLNLSEEISLVTARVRQLLPRLLSGEAQTRWKDVKEEWKNLPRAQRVNDPITLAESAKNLDRLLSDANQDYMVWDDLYKAMNQQERLIKQEQKRRMDMNALISTEDAIGFVSEILNIVKENVDDEETLERIYASATRAMTHRSGMKHVDNEGNLIPRKERGKKPALVTADGNGNNDL